MCGGGVSGRRGRRATATATTDVTTAPPSVSHPMNRMGSNAGSRAKPSAPPAATEMPQPAATTAKPIGHEGQRRRPTNHTPAASTSPNAGMNLLRPCSSDVAGTGGTERTRVRSHVPDVVRTRTPPAPRLATTGRLLRLRGHGRRRLRRRPSKRARPRPRRCTRRTRRRTPPRSAGTPRSTHHPAIAARRHAAAHSVAGPVGSARPGWAGTRTTARIPWRIGGSGAVRLTAAVPGPTGPTGAAVAPPGERSIRPRGTSTPNASRSLRSRAVTPPSMGAAASATPGTALSTVKPKPATTRPRRAPSTTASSVPTMATPATSLSFPVHHPGNRCFRTWSLRASITTQARNAGRPSHRHRPPKSCPIPSEPPPSPPSTWTV
jgi:hypothetical protein